MLHEGVELPLVAYTRRNSDLQGRASIEAEEVGCAVRVLRTGGVPVWGSVRADAEGGDGGSVVDESVVSTDSVIDGSKVYEFGSDGDARTSQCGRCSDDATGGGSDFSFSVAGAAAEDEWKFEKGWIKKFRVARRSVAKAGGFGVASVYGPLATAEEDMVEEPVNIMFIPPKPRVPGEEQDKRIISGGSGSSSRCSRGRGSRWGSRGSGGGGGGSSEGRVGF